MHVPGATERLVGLENHKRFFWALSLQMIRRADARDTCANNQHIEVFGIFHAHIVRIRRWSSTIRSVSSSPDANANSIGAHGLLIFDGECGFCRRWVRHMTSWFAKHPTTIAWQQANLGELGLTSEQCNAAVQFVGADLRISSGSDAAARVLIVAGMPFSIAGFIMLAPGVRGIAQWAYGWVANNRHRFKGDPLPP